MDIDHSTSRYVWEYVSALPTGNEPGYILRKCPSGHQLVNSSEIGGRFNPELQRCRPCGTDQYIINQYHTCQKCPPGLVCDGTEVVTPLVNGSIWNLNDATYELAACPYGRAVVNMDNGEFNAEVQRCAECSVGEECTMTLCTECSPCQPGYYKSFDGTAQCDSCPADTYRERSGARDLDACQVCPPDSTTWGLRGQVNIMACKCKQDHYLDSDGTCKVCPPNAECPYNTSLQTIVVMPNFWRDSMSTSRLFGCNRDVSGRSTCLGSNHSGGERRSQKETLARDSDRYCVAGHRGPLCSVCSEPSKYFDKTTAQCQHCKPSMAGYVFLSIAAVGGLCYLAVEVSRAHSSKVSASQTFHARDSIPDTLRTTVKFLRRTAPRLQAFSRQNTLQAKFKIMISFFQVFNTLTSVYGVGFHPNFTGWLSFLSIADFDQELLLPEKCVGTMQRRLAFSAFGPWAAAVLATLCSWAHSFLFHRGANHSDMLASALSVFIFIFYLVLPSVSRTIFSAKQCESFESDDSTGESNSYLAADFDIKCSPEDRDYSELNGYFWTYFLLWPVLVPLSLLILLLYTQSSVRMQRRTKLSIATRFLWQDYTVDVNYWEIIDMMRKLFVTALILFVDTEYGSRRLLRLVCACIVSAMYLTVLACVRPYKRSEDLYLACTSNLLLLCCFTSSISIKLCEERQWSNSCEAFLGLSGSYQTNVFVVVLTVVMLALSLLIIIGKTVYTISAPTICVVSTRQEPVLELPNHCKFHCFLSHAWSTGQDQTHLLARKLQLLLPDVKIWLDVDSLDDVGKLERSVAESASFIIFLSQGYFQSPYCRRELFAALALGKPIIAVREPDKAKGGATVIELIAECRESCNDINEYNRVIQEIEPDFKHFCTLGYSGPQQIIERLFDLSNEPVVWVRVHDFQLESLKDVVFRMLEHSPHYQRYPLDLRGGLKVHGELGPHYFNSPIHLLVCDANEGAMDVARALEKASLECKGAIRLSIHQTSDSFDLDGPKSKQNTVMLLYLNRRTFRTFSDLDSKLADITKWALDQQISITLVHEQDDKKGGCPFRVILEQTPKEFQSPPHKLFDTLAVPYFSASSKHCTISLRHILRNMGAKPLRAHGNTLQDGFMAYQAHPAPHGDDGYPEAPDTGSRSETPFAQNQQESEMMQPETNTRQIQDLGRGTVLRVDSEIEQVTEDENLNVPKTQTEEAFAAEEKVETGQLFQTLADLVFVKKHPEAMEPATVTAPAPVTAPAGTRVTNQLHSRRLDLIM